MGTLRGRVTVRNNGAPVITASVQIIRMERPASTDAEGNCEIRNVPSGRYDVISHMHALTDEMRTIRIVGGQETAADFQLSLAPLRHEVTVTATGHEETAFESFQAVTTAPSSAAGCGNRRAGSCRGGLVSGCRRLLPRRLAFSGLAVGTGSHHEGAGIYP